MSQHRRFQNRTNKSARRGFDTSQDQNAPRHATPNQSTTIQNKKRKYTKTQEYKTTQQKIPHGNTALNNTTPYSTTLQNATQDYETLHELHNTTPYSTTLRNTTQQYTHTHTRQHYTTLHHTRQHYTKLQHYTTPDNTTQYYTTLHDTRRHYTKHNTQYTKSSQRPRAQRRRGRLRLRPRGTRDFGPRPTDWQHQCYKAINMHKVVHK